MPKPGPGPRCSIETTRRLLDPDGQQTLDLLFDDHEQHGWTDEDMADALNVMLTAKADEAAESGKPIRVPEITWSIVGHHRRHKCRCTRS